MALLVVPDGVLRHAGLGAQTTAPRPASTWNLVFDRPIVGKYEDFAFPDATHGWLVSARGDILATADGGLTWTVQAQNKGTIRSVDFLDTRRGFAGTLSGVLYGTVDGGATWTDVTTSLPVTVKGFCGMTHVGEQFHMVGRYTGAAADYFFSPDGGKTWRYQDLKTLAQGLVDVSFVSASTGFIGGMSSTGPAGAGPARLLKTIDGGRTWRAVFTDDGGRGFVWKIWPISASLIYAAMQSQDGIYRIAKSTDAGETWTVHVAAKGRVEGPGVQGIGFLDANTGWIGGFFTGMWATTDGGDTWTEVPMSDRAINRFEKVGAGTLITAGSRGILRYEAAKGRE